MQGKQLVDERVIYEGLGSNLYLLSLLHWMLPESKVKADSLVSTVQQQAGHYAYHTTRS